KKNYGPINRLIIFGKLLDANYREIPSPNTDTVYVGLTFNVKKEPLVLDIPAGEPDRYYVVPFYDAYTNVFESLGTRTNKTEGGTYLIVAPDFTGDIPEGMKVIKAPTYIGTVIGRYLVKGKEDLPNVVAIHKQIKVATLSEWQSNNIPESVWALDDPKGDDKIIIPDYQNDPQAYWEAVNEILPLAPVSEISKEDFEKFSEFGITQSGFKPNESNIKDLYEGTNEGWNQLKQIATDVDSAKKMGVNFFESNNWSWSSVGSDPENTGKRNYGTEYELRSWVNLLYYGMLPPQEALYPTAYVDQNKEKLHGQNQYEFTININNQPNFNKGFWSVTLYDMEGYFYDNAPKIYKLSDRTKGIKIKENGDITIRISHEKPSDLEVNWLPAPLDNFYLMLRSYLPIPSLVSGEYSIQPVVKI
ncbi:DUF1254 domain-containing protein, partial [Listeria innocua]